MELRLPKNVSIEFDALYRTSKTSVAGQVSFGLGVNAYNTSSFQTTNAWDLPLLLKYRIPARAIHPFVSAGYQWTHLSRERSFQYQCTGPLGSCLPAGSSFPEPRAGQFEDTAIQRGLAAGAGLEFKTRYVTIAPEVRFNRNFDEGARDNRFTGLIGFTFGKN